MIYGIVYLNQDGMAVSPLITWQDRRGDEKCCGFKRSGKYKTQSSETGERSYAQILSVMSGYHLSTRYGSVTLFYDSVNRKVPHEASQIATIGDYVAMKLCG